MPGFSGTDARQPASVWTLRAKGLRGVAVVFQVTSAAGTRLEFTTGRAVNGLRSVVLNADHEEQIGWLSLTTFSVAAIG